jgi:uncharacterized membrane-anchored protein
MKVKNFLGKFCLTKRGTNPPFRTTQTAACDILAAMAGRHRPYDPALASGMVPEASGGEVSSSKVPKVTPYFWVVKILTTAMGEATSDFLVHQFNPYLAVFMGFVVFAVAITVQFAARTYSTWKYWIAVSMVAVFGTMVADSMHVGLGIPYKVTATLFAVLVAIALTVWYLSERTLSIHSITNRRREFFYWATVICTFALGTATGDLTASTLHLGYLLSGIVFALAILVPLAAWRLGVNSVLTFWVAYILTRPIGASFADYFGMPKTSGGLGIGHGPVSLVTIIVVAGMVWYLAATHKDVPSSAGADVRSGYEPGPGYPPQPGYGPQPGYPSQQGYGPQRGQVPPPGYPPQPGYGPEAGYDGPRPEYRPGPGYAPDGRQGPGAGPAGPPSAGPPGGPRPGPPGGPPPGPRFYPNPAPGPGTRPYPDKPPNDPW